jgi:hypothetical protein
MPAQLHAYAAVSPSGGRNVYVPGRRCIECDPAYDPHYRRGVPCRQARDHALRDLANWECGRLEVVDVASLPARLRP